MADLPKDHLEPSPPFTNVGEDVFGPWQIITRKTRGGSANSKRWAVMFTCLVIRAVHIELVEEMTSSAYINALKRFTSVRGKVKFFRSDQGTNFVGAVKELYIKTINPGHTLINVDEDPAVSKYLHDAGTTWQFNPAHSSHMGGAWERMIGVTRRILDSLFLENSGKTPTHDVLNTFMAEACAIINSRPLVPVSSDPESPLILTPALLLNLKTDYVFLIDNPEPADKRDLYRIEWKWVQALASMFWTRWKREYLPLLQRRRKWTEVRRDLRVGDVVLVKDNSLCRTQWPTGIITNAVQGSDDHVRKVEVRIMVDGKPKTYTRPITELVLLVEADET